MLKKCIKQQRAEWVALFDSTLDVENSAVAVCFDCGCLLRVEGLYEFDVRCGYMLFVKCASELVVVD